MAADAFSRNPVVAVITTDTLIDRQNEITDYGIRKYRTVNGIAVVKYRGVERIVVPQSLINDILFKTHDEMNHPGEHITLRLIANRYWWPNRDIDVAQYVRTCHTCQIVKPPFESTAGTIRPIETPNRPNALWAIDTIVMGKAADNTSAKYILTVVDHHSRYVWVSAVKRNTAEAAINFLSRLFDSVGVPDALLSDNGTSFTSKRFRNYLESRKVTCLLTPPYRPQANGICEKANDLIIKGIRLALTDKPKLRWSSVISAVATSINDQPHEITRFASRYLHFGLTSKEFEPPETSVEDARILATERSRNAQQERKRKHDKKHVASNVNIGDYVKYRLPGNHPSRDKLTPYFVGPCIVVDKLGEETFRLDQIDVKDKTVIKTFVAHTSYLFQYFRRMDTSSSVNIANICEETNATSIPIDTHVNTIIVDVFANSNRNLCLRTPKVGQFQNVNNERVLTQIAKMSDDLNNGEMECDSDYDLVCDDVRELVGELVDGVSVIDFWSDLGEWNDDALPKTTKTIDDYANDIAHWVVSDALEAIDNDIFESIQIGRQIAKASTMDELYGQSSEFGNAYRIEIGSNVNADTVISEDYKVIVKWGASFGSAREADKWIAKVNEKKLPYLRLELRSHLAFVFLQNENDFEDWTSNCPDDVNGNKPKIFWSDRAISSSLESVTVGGAVTTYKS